MAKDSSKQILANLIQTNEAIVIIARSGYGDDELKNWLTAQSCFNSKMVRLQGK